MRINIDKGLFIIRQINLTAKDSALNVIRQINLTAKDSALNVSRQINLTAKDNALNIHYRLIDAVSFAVRFSERTEKK